ncbi:hypothetical protein BDR22DRAFT_823114 [Usnea florida]
MQESDFIPQGIPALYEYSERVHRGRRRAKELLNVFMNVTTRHRGRLLDVRLAPLILVLAYLSKPMISSMLSTVWEDTGRLKKGIATSAHHSSYVTKATQTWFFYTEHAARFVPDPTLVQFEAPSDDELEDGVADGVKDENDGMSDAELAPPSRTQVRTDNPSIPPRRRCKGGTNGQHLISAGNWAGPSRSSSRGSQNMIITQKFDLEVWSDPGPSQEQGIREDV